MPASRHPSRSAPSARAPRAGPSPHQIRGEEHDPALGDGRSHAFGRALEGALESAPQEIAQGQLVLPGWILDFRLAALTGERPGSADGVVETAQLVHQLQLLGALARVDAPLRQLPYPRLGHAATLRHRFHELAVDVVGDPLDLLAVSVAERTEGRERVLVLPGLQRGLLDLRPLQQAAD